MTEMICMGPQLLETNECLIATLESIGRMRGGKVASQTTLR